MCGKIREASLFFIITHILLLCGCAGGGRKAPVSETRLLLDTVCSITLYDPPDRAVLEDALDLCAGYESLLSVTIEGSDVWRINHADGKPVAVSAQTTEIVLEGLRYGDLSDGMFDISIGRLSGLWNFKGNPAVPLAEELAIAIETVDYRKIVVSGDTVQLTDPESRLDLGGIAKGYIADRVAAFLKERGVKAAVIDLGGNVVAVGRKPSGEKWRVGVRKPFDDSGKLLGTIETGAASIVTSGVYERQFESGGVVYHHIINPYTGMPVVSDVVSATVLTESSMAGDALSTILVLMGSGMAEKLADEATGFIGAALLLSSGDVMQIGEVELRASS